jgi:hypothetical protein
MRTLPEAIQCEIVARLYSDAVRLDWGHLSMPERRRQYERWISEPAVGGIIGQFLTPERARVWIKDGPMKEYSRSLAGVGPFAKFLPTHSVGAEGIVQMALGGSWSVVAGSAGIKPLHCRAQSELNGLQFLCWGTAKDFKHLLWAALRASDAGRIDAMVIVIESIGHELQEIERGRLAHLCARCGLAFSTLQPASR